MAKKEYWVEGDWNAICDICGFKFKASDLRLRWDGFRVCDKDFETRHPQDLPHRIPKETTPTWTRPDVEWVPILTCTLAGRSGYAGLGVTGCMLPGQTWGLSADEIVDLYICSPTSRLALSDVGTADCATV